MIQNSKKTLCWECKNAVPIDEYGCQWSKWFKPVEGWTVEKHYQEKTDKYGADRTKDSYCVINCPEFIKG